MPNKLIQFSFSGGVFSPSIHGRADLEKYSLGLRDALNYFVDYRGGVVSRAGFEFGDVIPDAAAGVRFFRFRFNARLANTFLLIWTEEALHFAQDNAFVLDGGVPYTISTPYAGADLESLVFRQRRNEVIITHPDYPPYLLTRLGPTNWTLEPVAFGDTDLTSPTGRSATASGAGSASILWTVTAVGQDGKESVLTGISTLSSIVNYTATAGSVTFTWDSVPGAAYYKVYRSLVFPGAPASGQELGYIGRSLTPSLIDTNIIPDFTQNPPMLSNPFQPGGIDYITITAGGTGYTTATVSVSGAPGSGFVGFPLLEAGVVVGVIVLNAGKDYIAPTVTIGGDGTGATATATLGATEGLYPAASVVHNQRLWLLGSTVFPLRLTASRSEGDLLNFNQGIFPTATDPIILDIDSGELTPIRYGEVVNDSIFVFTDQSIWQVALADGSYKASLRTENGAGIVPPILVNRDVLFTLSEGTGVWALRPSNLPNYYVDVDLTTFAGHLFSKDDEITAWAFAREPYRIVWAATRRGRLLSMTYIAEQNVYAWMPHNTRGLVRALTVLQEDGIDRVYIAVERANGVFFERAALRQYATPEEIWSVDSGLRSLLTYPAASLSLTETAANTYTCTASASVFSSSDVGAHVRAGGGRGEVLTYVSPTEITVFFDMPVTARSPQTDTIPLFVEGEWSLTPLQTVFSGFDHLEGEEIEIFADGSDFGTAVVSGGSITLDQPASYVLGGLGFNGFTEILPLVAQDKIIEDRVKRITSLSARVENTRGLRYGIRGVQYSMKERTTEPMRAPTRFQQGIKSLSVSTNWRADDVLRFEKRGPGCNTILNLIVDVEIGDDDD